MAVGYIEECYNNYDHELWVKSTDTIHNGDFGGTNLDDGEWHKLPLGHTKLNYFGNPWYTAAKKYKEFTYNPDTKEGIKIYQSEMDNKNWIVWKDRKNENALFKQECGHSDYHMKMIIEENGCFYLERQNQQWSTLKTLNAIGNVVKSVAEFVKTIASIVTTVKPKPLGVVNSGSIHRESLERDLFSFSPLCRFLILTRKSIILSQCA
mmetsp:Transcript_17282/g.47590  ORF Transcript_17282/g.47590 Transcript_17282/m.47590 type:complete len:208 (-) Transcript_17282:1033-1656(-)